MLTEFKHLRPPAFLRSLELGVGKGEGCLPLLPEHTTGWLPAWPLRPPAASPAAEREAGQFIRAAKGRISRDEGSSKYKSKGNKPSRFLIPPRGFPQGHSPAERTYLLPLYAVKVSAIVGWKGHQGFCSTSASGSETMSIFHPFP